MIVHKNHIALNPQCLILTMMLVFGFSMAHAQVKVTGKFSPDLEQQIQKAQKLQGLYKKYEHDSAKIARKELKKIKKSTDSLAVACRKQKISEIKHTLTNQEEVRALTLRQQQARTLLNEYSEKTGSIKKPTKAQIGEMLTTKTDQYPEFRAYHDQINKQTAPVRKALDKFKVVPQYQDSLSRMATKTDSTDLWKESEDLVASNLKNTEYYRHLSKDEQAMFSEEDFKKDLPDALKNFDINDISTHPLQKARQTGMKFFEGKDEQVQAAMQELDKLKKKYDYVADSKDLEDAHKVNSLSGQPFKKRLVFGGDLRFEFGNPFTADIDPYAGYKLNRRWTAGAGVTIKWQLSHTDSTDTRSSISKTGLRGFSEYTVYKSFLVHGEYEVIADNIFRKSRETETKGSIPAQSINLGLGKTFGLAKGLRGKVLILYNITLDGERPYKSPWVVRVGLMN